MSTVVRGHADIRATRDTLSFGPWTFDNTDIFDEFFGAEIQLTTHQFAQIIGGTDPEIAALVSLQTLLIYPDVDIKVGFDLVNAQTAGFTLSAYRTLRLSGGLLTGLSLYNPALVTTKVFLVLGGS